MPSGNTQNLNGLGISADGDSVYGVLPAQTGSGRTIHRLVRSTDTVSQVGTGVTDSTGAPVPVTHGAVNPQTGFYYYGGVSGTNLRIHGFNTTTNQSIGLVATSSLPNAPGGNGDWAFDKEGRSTSSPAWTTTAGSTSSASRCQRRQGRR